MPKEVPLKSEHFNPFGEMIGLNFTKIGEGNSECALEIREDLHNPYGVLHGGVIYSMVDTGMGGALFTRLNEDELCATVEIKISYFRFIISGTLTCKTRVVHKTRSLGYLESEVYRGKRLLAKASGTFIIFQATSLLR
jgi:acyl-CoA thioesterase